MPRQVEVTREVEAALGLGKIVIVDADSDKEEIDNSTTISKSSEEEGTYSMTPASLTGSDEEKVEEQEPLGYCCDDEPGTDDNALFLQAMVEFEKRGVSGIHGSIDELNEGDSDGEATKA